MATQETTIGKAIGTMNIPTSSADTEIQSLVRQGFTVNYSSDSNSRRAVLLVEKFCTRKVCGAEELRNRGCDVNVFCAGCGQNPSSDSSSPKAQNSSRTGRTSF